MASIKTNFAVGLFTLAGIAIITAVIIYVGAVGYLRKGSLYSTYFNESVQGLSKDSPVKYRGVSVGQVHEINIAQDARLVEVLLRIESDWQPDEEIIAQLKSIGITGIMFVELDIREPSDRILVPASEYHSSHPVIPTKQSEIKQLLTGVADVVAQLKAADLGEVFKKAEQTIENIDNKVKDARVNEISGSLQSAINKANHILNTRKWDEMMASAGETGAKLDRFAGNAVRATDRVNTLLDENEAELTGAVAELRATLARTRQLVGGGSQLINKTDESMIRIERRLGKAIRHLEEASRELDLLTAKSASQPSQLFFGAPPPKKEIEKYD
ncbi:MAG: MlaD family protein [Desulfosudaceae bacterium]